MQNGPASVPFTLWLPTEMQGPACPTLTWYEDGAQRAACTRQVHYAALGTKGSGKRVGSALPLCPPFGL